MTGAARPTVSVSGPEASNLFSRSASLFELKRYFPVLYQILIAAFAQHQPITGNQQNPELQR
jgi:hypothetical protein